MGRYDCAFAGPRSGLSNEVYDFIRFVRAEGRFAKRFDKDGNPSEKLLKARQERLENWRTL